jgi:hypothetical protein
METKKLKRQDARTPQSKPPSDRPQKPNSKFLVVCCLLACADGGLLFGALASWRLAFCPDSLAFVNDLN